MSTKSIAQVQQDLEAALEALAVVVLPPQLQALSQLVPPGMRPKISLRHVDGDRQIKSNASSSSFSPEKDKVVLSFERLPVQPEAPTPSTVRATQDSVPELVAALADAQRDPRFRDFVALKPFRDRFLVERGLTWAQDAHECQAVLTRAIEDRLILTSKVPNPKSPQFPTTSIRLNQSHPTVQRILGKPETDGVPFLPIAIHGGGLSETVISERR